MSTSAFSAWLHGLLGPRLAGGPHALRFLELWMGRPAAPDGANRMGASASKGPVREPDVYAWRPDRGEGAELREALERRFADMGRKMFRALLLLERNAVRTPVPHLAQGKAESGTGAGRVADDAEQDHLQGEDLSAHLDLKVLNSFGWFHGLTLSDLDGLSPEDYFVSFFVKKEMEHHVRAAVHDVRSRPFAAMAVFIRAGEDAKAKALFDRLVVEAVKQHDARRGGAS
ncbi:hypothetical protein [Azorhizobium sp. AG788]|uniref:hypothetical protein n=1 Tax=Azorhizobium sp. AG788 TaxID=2183897 RepID=UPI003138E0A6